MPRPGGQAVGSKLARLDFDLGRRGWMRGGSERMNGQAKDLDQRNTSFICDRDELGLGLAENLRLSSLNGRKIVEAPSLISDASSCGPGGDLRTVRAPCHPSISPETAKSDDNLTASLQEGRF